MLENLLALDDLVEHVNLPGWRRAALQRRGMCPRNLMLAVLVL
jgi:hypothetical protein